MHMYGIIATLQSCINHLGDIHVYNVYTNFKISNSIQIVMDTQSILEAAEYKDTQEVQYSFTKAKVLRVYDGDTFWIAAQYENGVYRFNCRLYGIDCCEMKSLDSTQKSLAVSAKDYVSKRILGKIVDIEVLNNKLYQGKMIKEKYGRLLVKVNVGGKDLAQEMIDLGLGKSYFGGTKN